MDIMVKEDDSLKEAPFFELKNPKRQAQLEEYVSSEDSILKKHFMHLNNKIL